ncbi:hypothetical protein [Thiobaca trueperi]|uniref:Transmembrane protein n=1 Tax=Thiobaca trueperi TaxID=127458 RepID=A0A4R3MS01_9GAMM|nr:hypothetical protein [Thiobaca trueperi]TCT19150.1 hypothetical protein EDC35_10928 [Thiobaca trueperi]
MSYVHPLSTNEIPDAPLIADVRADQDQSNLSAVAWGAVFAGAATAASLWMILMILGAGLGLSSIPLWLNGDMTAGTVGVATIAWLVFSTIAASGMGGYIAGRFRTRWYGVPRDEVWFRDTAHGFLAWAVSALVTAAVLTTMIGSVVNNGIKAGAEVVDAAPGAELTGVRANGGGTSDPLAYYIDALYRTNTTDGQRYTPSAAVTAEISRVFTKGLLQGSLPAVDVRYVGATVAEQTGLTQDDAQTRVADTFAQLQNQTKELETNARVLAEQARKAAATATIWLFISLLSGAFLASLLAIYGGRQRDE